MLLSKRLGQKSSFYTLTLPTRLKSRGFAASCPTTTKFMISTVRSSASRFRAQCEVNLEKQETEDARDSATILRLVRIPPNLATRANQREMTRRKPTAREDLRLIENVLKTPIDPNSTTAILNRRLMELEAVEGIAFDRASITKGKDRVAFLNSALEAVTARAALLKTIVRSANPPSLGLRSVGAPIA